MIRHPLFAGAVACVLSGGVACSSTDPAPAAEQPAPAVPNPATPPAAATEKPDKIETPDKVDKPDVKPRKGVETGPASPEIVAAARSIQKDLECLRGLKFKQDPKVAFQSVKDFRAYIDKQMAKEFSSEKGARMVRVLHALKIVDPKIDLLEDLAQAAVDQAAAYYDPDTDTFHVVMELPEMMLTAVMAHELQHALQDQHTEMLDQYLADGFGSIDRDLAARFVVEGEATFVGTAWVSHRMLSRMGTGVCHLPGKAGSAPSDFWPAVREQVAVPAGQTREETLNPGDLEKLALAAVSETLVESLEKLKDVPNFVFYTLLLPYNQGGLTMYDQFASGGFDWKKVDAIFDDLPQSTEEVLHPEKLAKGGEKFRDIKFKDAPLPAAALTGWTEDPPDRIGELTTRILLIEHGVAERDANERAEGWNGDAVRVFHSGDQLAFEWIVAWDSSEDAAQFRSVLPAVIASQRGLDAATLRSIADAGPSEAGRTDFQWTDDEGRTKHGFVSWTADQLRWTDGWPAAPGL